MLNANEPDLVAKTATSLSRPPSLPWLELTCGHAFKESRGWGRWVLATRVQFCFSVEG